MASLFLKEYLLSQLCRLGIKWPPKEENKKPVVEQTLKEAGFSSRIPTDDIPVALIPGVIRLDKESWLSCVSVEAAFSADVEDGMLVTVDKGIWKPVNQVQNSEKDKTAHYWGIAYTQVGRVMLGPVVFHKKFSYVAGTMLYAGDAGTLTDVENEVFVGVCVAPGTIMLKQL